MRQRIYQSDRLWWHGGCRYFRDPSAGFGINFKPYGNRFIRIIVLSFASLPVPVSRGNEAASTLLIALIYIDETRQKAQLHLTFARSRRQVHHLLFTPESRLWSLNPLMIALSIIPSNEAILDRADHTRGTIPLNFFFHNSVRIGQPRRPRTGLYPLSTDTRKSYGEPNSWHIPLQGRRNHFHGLQPSRTTSS